MPTKTRPNEVPTGVATAPREPTAAELAAAQQGGTGSLVPVIGTPLDTPKFEPPGTAAAAAASSVAAGWLSNKHVLMLWQTTAPMDNWAYLDGGTGWKHLTQAGDVATRGMGVLAGAARSGGGIVQAYEGTSGTLDAFYLW